MAAPDTHADLWRDELPQAPDVNDPSWRENFCFNSYDRDRQVGFWLHLGRWPHDPSLWREQFLIYLADGSFLVHRSWGNRETAFGPAGPCLSLTCEEPGRRWRVDFHGPARRAHPRELTGPLAEGSQLLLDASLTFTSSNDLWYMGAELEGENWANFHIEQVGAVTGQLRFQGQTLDVDTYGWRDHSRGPRNLVGMQRHCWISGELPAGRSFAMTAAETKGPDGKVARFTSSVIWDGGRIVPAYCPDPPYLTAYDTIPPSFTLRLESAAGNFDLEADVFGGLPHSTLTTGDSIDGVADEGAQIVTWVQGTVFRVDGELFSGHSERSYRTPTAE